MKLGEWNRAALVQVGLVAGIAQAAAGVAMYLAGVYFEPWSMLVSVFVLLLCIVLGTRWYAAHHLKGGITYLQALTVGIVISVSTGLVYAVYNMVSISFFYPHFLDDLTHARIAQAVSHQQSPGSFETLRAEVSAAGIAIPNLIRLSIMGAFLSLLSSWFLKKRG